LWKKIINENIDKAIIFEDDCVPSSSFSNRINHILNELPKDFNIVWLGGMHVENYTCLENIKVSENVFIKKEDRNYCIFSYILSKQGALKLYNYAMNEFRGNLGADTFIYEFFTKNNIIQHVVSPMICHSGINHDVNSIFCSDIQPQ